MAPIRASLLHRVVHTLAVRAPPAIHPPWPKQCAGYRRLATLLLLVMVALLTAWLVNTRQQYSDFLRRSLEGPMAYDDPELIQYVKREILVPPSTLPYQLEGRRNLGRLHILDSEAFYMNASEDLFRGMRGGVFVEAGALDGETMSNTLRLEKVQGWSGLLVEADRASFALMAAKNRRAWTANTCLAPNSYPSQELISTTSLYKSGISYIAEGIKLRAMIGISKYLRKQESLSNLWFKRVQCVPLPTLLLALALRHVDLLVLDVEGAELAILEHLDLDHFDVRVIYLEWKVLSDKEDIRQRIEAKGYKLFRQLREDYIFVKNSVKYDQLAVDHKV